MVSQNGWPIGVFGVRRFRHNPEALVRMVNEGDDFTLGRANRPGAPQEIECEVMIETPLEIEGQMKVEQRSGRNGQEAGTFLLARLFPGLIRSELCGSAAGVFVMPVDLGFEQLIGRGVVGNFFERQECDQTFLKDQETSFDFAFGLSIGSHAVVNPHGGESALELGVGIQTVGRGTVTEQTEAIGVNTGWQTVLFQDPAQMTEMAPSGVAGDEGAAQDFTGVIIQGQNQSGILFGGPPAMRRGIMLPEFSNGGALPAAAGFWTGPQGRDPIWKLLSNVSGDRGPGSFEVKATFQFVGQQREIQRLTMRQDLGQKAMGWQRPCGLVISTGSFEFETILVAQPLVTQFVEPAAPDHEPLGSSVCIQLAGVERAEDFPDKERRSPVG